MPESPKLSQLRGSDWGLMNDVATRGDPVGHTRARTQRKYDFSDEEMQSLGEAGDNRRHAMRLRHLVGKAFRDSGQPMPDYWRDVLSENPDWDMNDVLHFSDTDEVP